MTFCDDLYDQAEEIADVYPAIADRVIAAAMDGPVVFAVPGSPLVGEFAVRLILEAAVDAEVIPGESFVDLVLSEVGCDPLDRGLQILNGHDLPDPLVMDKPTIIGHVDHPRLLADVLDAVSRVTAEDTVATVLCNLGSEDPLVVTAPIDALEPSHAGLQTSLFVDAEPGGIIGAVRVMRRLRLECPWDREQTHASLVKNLIEETYELIDAIAGLAGGDIDWVAYAGVEDELGDVLLQVLFHSAIARQAGGFDIDGVAEVLRRKLIRRHPHVFGDTTVTGPDEVKRNWDRIKEAESGVTTDSLLGGVSAGLPAVQRASKIQNRAAKVGFDWSTAAEVLPKVREEIEELTAAMCGEGDIQSELGDTLFAIINLARHLGLDPELALTAANQRFEERFRRMEADGPLDGLSLHELDRRWERAKSD